MCNYIMATKNSLLKYLKVPIIAGAIVGLISFSEIKYNDWRSNPISPADMKAVEVKHGKKQINFDNLDYQEAIKAVETPEEAQEYLDKYFTFDSDYTNSKKTVLGNHLKKIILIGKEYVVTLQLWLVVFSRIMDMNLICFTYVKKEKMRVMQFFYIKIKKMEIMELLEIPHYMKNVIV